MLDKHADIVTVMFLYFDDMLPRELQPYSFPIYIMEVGRSKGYFTQIYRQTIAEEGFYAHFKGRTRLQIDMEELVEAGVLETRKFGVGEAAGYRLTKVGLAAGMKMYVRKKQLADREKRIQEMQMEQKK